MSHSPHSPLCGALLRQAPLGFGPLHALSDSDRGRKSHGMQAFVVGSQTGLVAEWHCELSQHPTQIPPAVVSQLGVLGWLAHCEFVVQPVAQRLVLVSHTGLLGYLP